MSDQELKEQMERETLGAWRSPALKKLEEKRNHSIIIAVAGIVTGIIIGVLLG